VGNNFKLRWEKEDIFVKNKIMFGDVLKLETSKDYELITDKVKLIKVLDEK
jgi:hypothetical protein